MVNDFPVGEILTTTNRIQWRISDFLQLQQEPSATLLSPVFLYYGEICILELSKNGHAGDFNEGWLGLECEIYSLKRASVIRCSILDHWGREILHTNMEMRNSVTYLKEKWIKLTELVSRRKEILPHGQLHIVCTVLPGQDGVKESELADQVNETNNSSYATNEGLDELSQCLKNMYLESRDCDVIIRVKDTEFHSHRFLLKLRSPAFNAMLSHNMLENNAGIINIDDCDPKIFNDFLIFLYSGKVENLSSGNMCGLYQLADKYDLPILKSMCLNFIKSSLSVKRICDIIWLAHRHEEVELLTQAVVFFVNNVDEILGTAKWLLFMEQHAALANSLIQQTLLFYKMKSPLCTK